MINGFRCRVRYFDRYVLMIFRYLVRRIDFGLFLICLFDSLVMSIVNLLSHKATGEASDLFFSPRQKDQTSPHSSLFVYSEVTSFSLVSHGCFTDRIVRPDRAEDSVGCRTPLETYRHLYAGSDHYSRCSHRHQKEYS